jgi:hypothetical protein
MILAGTVYVTSRRQAAGAWQLGGWGRKHTTGTAAVVFADLSASRPRFHVVLSWWLRAEIDDMRARNYPDGHRPRNDASEHVGIWPQQVSGWDDDWRAAYTAVPAAPAIISRGHPERPEQAAAS